LSKSISKGNGVSTYRGLVDIKKTATNSVSKVDCDGLLIDEYSVSNAIPTISVANTSSVIAHEASAGKMNEDDIFYLQSR
jgi:Fe-S cluster assembly protein SufB